MIPIPRVIHFSGLDGSGKTTLIEMLLDDLRRTPLEARYLWMRYNHYITKPLLAYCRLIGLTKYNRIDGITVGSHHFYKSNIVSYLFIIFSLLDTKIATEVKINSQLHNTNNILICDRYIIDILVDLMIDTNKPNLYKTPLGHLFLQLIPQNTKIFYVKRPTDHILKSRPELAHDPSLNQRLLIYEKVTDYCNATILNNHKDINITYNKLCSHLSDCVSSY